MGRGLRNPREAKKKKKNSPVHVFQGLMSLHFQIFIHMEYKCKHLFMYIPTPFKMERVIQRDYVLFGRYPDPTDIFKVDRLLSGLFGISTLTFF